MCRRPSEGEDPKRSVMSLLYAGGYFSRKWLEITKDFHQIEISIP
jgi:hypothetical protein